MNEVLIGLGMGIMFWSLALMFAADKVPERVTDKRFKQMIENEIKTIQDRKLR